MPLTPRAQKFLTKLRRLPAVPVSDVVAALERAGAPAYPAWLDFHERYAGYVESLGRESAIWGLVHRDSHWIAPGEVDVMRDDAEDGDGQLMVMCAEAHGSFYYRLYEDGHFSSYGGGGPCESFDVKVEQNAIFSETRSDGRNWEWELELMRVPPGGMGPIAEALGARRVDEASDKFFSVWVGPEVIWIASPEEGMLLNLFVVDSAHERVKALLRAAG
jgi:hypothetical protein